MVCGKERKAAQRNLFSTAELIFVNHVIQINNPKKNTTLALPTSKPSSSTFPPKSHLFPKLLYLSLSPSPKTTGFKTREFVWVDIFDSYDKKRKRFLRQRSTHLSTFCVPSPVSPLVKTEHTACRTSNLTTLETFPHSIRSPKQQRICHQVQPVHNSPSGCKVNIHEVRFPCTPQPQTAVFFFAPLVIRPSIPPTNYLDHQPHSSSPTTIDANYLDLTESIFTNRFPLAVSPSRAGVPALGPIASRNPHFSSLALWFRGGISDRDNLTTRVYKRPPHSTPIQFDSGRFSKRPHSGYACSSGHFRSPDLSLSTIVA